MAPSSPTVRHMSVRNKGQRTPSRKIAVPSFHTYSSPVLTCDTLRKKHLESHQCFEIFLSREADYQKRVKKHAHIQRDKAFKLIRYSLVITALILLAANPVTALPVATIASILFLSAAILDLIRRVIKAKSVRDFFLDLIKLPFKEVWLLRTTNDPNDTGFSLKVFFDKYFGHIETGLGFFKVFLKITRPIFDLATIVFPELAILEYIIFGLITLCTVFSIAWFAHKELTKQKLQDKQLQEEDKGITGHFKKVHENTSRRIIFTGKDVTDKVFKFLEVLSKKDADINGWIGVGLGLINTIWDECRSSNRKSIYNEKKETANKDLYALSSALNIKKEHMPFFHYDNDEAYGKLKIKYYSHDNPKIPLQLGEYTFLKTRENSHSWKIIYCGAGNRMSIPLHYGIEAHSPILRHLAKHGHRVEQLNLSFASQAYKHALNNLIRSEYIKNMTTASIDFALMNVNNKGILKKYLKNNDPTINYCLVKDSSSKDEDWFIYTRSLTHPNQFNCIALNHKQDTDLLNYLINIQKYYSNTGCYSSSSLDNYLNKTLKNQEKCVIQRMVAISSETTMRFKEKAEIITIGDTPFLKSNSASYEEAKREEAQLVSPTSHLYRFFFKKPLPFSQQKLKNAMPNHQTLSQLL